jgi:lysophospholipase L1-like esterase
VPLELFATKNTKSHKDMHRIQNHTPLTHTLFFFRAFLCFLWLTPLASFGKETVTPAKVVRADSGTDKVVRGTPARVRTDAKLVRAIPNSARANADPNLDRFEYDITGFENWDAENSFPQGAILFIGSSSINFWRSADSFPELPVINRGFGGAHIGEVNHYFDRIVPKYKPRVIVFYCGDNDIAFGNSPDKVFREFQTFASRVHDQLPNTQLVYLPIKPSPSRWKLWPQMQIVNARVKELTRQNKQLIYIDTATPLLGPDGQPRKELYRTDGLHLNPAGYKVWNEILAPRLHELAYSNK